ncbi:hypothetical protein [Paenibacillus validus]|uniref:Uncharacterized protein n=1 Tax=Paenibacillus validus TaxID=44253 RepID=A0A7X3CRK7_9BACL|nr:hypothetical protein [Paenibacillus validus]MUG70342.1 hypothetical protein [Paenibacillus validus]
MKKSTQNDDETIISHHSQTQWQRREQELACWVQRAKPRKRPKQTVILGNTPVDAELLMALTLLKRTRIQTEFSCAGVSLLDEPEDHSLYAYITITGSATADRFVQLALTRMRHRLFVTWEPRRNRYDLSSFFIGHNRSFCLLMQRCAEIFAELEDEQSR